MRRGTHYIYIIYIYIVSYIYERPKRTARPTHDTQPKLRPLTRRPTLKTSRDTATRTGQPQTREAEQNCTSLDNAAALPMRSLTVPKPQNTVTNSHTWYDSIWSLLSNRPGVRPNDRIQRLHTATRPLSLTHTPTRHEAAVLSKRADPWVCSGRDAPVSAQQSSMVTVICLRGRLT